MKNTLLRLVAAATLWLAATPAAYAFEPKPAEFGLQPPASPNMVRLQHFHDDILLWIISAIVLFVAVLLVWVMIRYNAKANPVPSKTTHHVLLEVVWTIVPVIILLGIAIPSYKLLFYLDRTAEPDMTLKVTGYQWGWTYTYPDYEDLEFNADIIRAPKQADGRYATPEQDMEEINKYIPDGKGRRLLETYNPVVLPVGKNIQILTTATDVIHAWTIPAFGAKKDAVPGRTNETWFNISETGIYYGQCSEICGIDHAAMPISVYAVTSEEFESWIACMKGDGASADFPARTCVQTLGFDKYRSLQNGPKTAAATSTTTDSGASE
jgi:cytochrome c oxidase subunit 2